jgi:hypothetical protein
MAFSLGFHSAILFHYGATQAIDAHKQQAEMQKKAGSVYQLQNPLSTKHLLLSISIRS